MTREEHIDFANALKNNYTIDFDKLPEFCDMAISALSTDGEYIKKEETLKALHDFWDECINFDGSGTELMLDNKGVIDDLPTYSFPEELSEDGTLTVHVSDGSKVKRVFVMGDNIFGGLYYPDSAENKGEWISVIDSYHEDGTIYESHWECSKCGSGRSGWGEFKFCPDCGADMRPEPYKGE